MKFQQLRSVKEAVRHGFNLTEVADALHSSQSAVSRQVSELEEELGVDLFVRSGRRLIGLTDAGRTLLPMIERLLQDADDIKRASQDFQGRAQGQLTIAATQSQAHYVLPRIIRDFTLRFPGVALHQILGTVHQVAELTINGGADICIAPDALAQYEQLITYPTYRYGKILILPPNHALLQLVRPLTLEDISAWPVITYEQGHAARNAIEHTFAQAGVPLNVTWGCATAEIVKSYVELDMGVGIIASVAWDSERDRRLQMIDVSHLLPMETIRVGWTRARFLPGYAYEFVEALDPALTRAVLKRALANR